MSCASGRSVDQVDQFDQVDEVDQVDQVDQVERGIEPIGRSEEWSGRRSFTFSYLIYATYHATFHGERSSGEAASCRE